MGAVLPGQPSTPLPTVTTLARAAGRSASGLEVSPPAATRAVAAARPLAVLRAYLALTKPTIIVLLIITTIPAMVLASRGWPDLRLVLATLLGGVLSAGGAASINQFADRDIDAVMSRTRHRPIPAGLVPAAHAAWLGVALALLSVAWLAWQVNLPAAALTAAAIAIYAGLYTYGLKRTTAQNIVIGGAAGAAPPLIGWAAVTGTVEVPALLLFLIVFCWTPPHFWALALRLQEDYRAASVPMAPVVWGAARTKLLIVCYSILLVAVTVMFGAVAQLGWIFFATASASGAGFVALALRLHREEGIEEALPLFFYSMAYLAALFASIMADELLLR